MNYRLPIAIILASVAFVSYGAQPEDEDTAAVTSESVTAAPVRTYYIEIVVQRAGVNKRTDVTLDLGQLLPRTLGIREQDLDKLKRSLVFSSSVDALNYLASEGWSLVDTYTQSAGAAAATHMVMAMEASEPKAVLRSLTKRK